MSDGERRIIVVKRIKKVQGGHHGGSWKVAYADFVTAMMAFFLVMWIMGMDEGVRDVVEGYFDNPIGFHQSFSGGMNPLSAGNSALNVSAHSFMLLSRAEQAMMFDEAAEELMDQLEAASQSESAPADYEVAITEAGLRIEIMERGDAETFFPSGSADIQPSLRQALALVLGEVEALPNRVVIEGHTDGRGFGPGSNYTNWELSGDRANAARRVLLSLGLDPGRIEEVRGYADRRLKRPEAPFAPENRRITLMLPYQEDLVRPPSEGGDEAMAAGGGGEPVGN